MADAYEEDDLVSTPAQIGGGRQSFVDYITSFTSTEKAQIMNLLQYGGLLVIPILGLLKLMKLYIPNDPSQLKATSELIIEVVLQLSVIIVAFFFIHKLVVYVPTYSQVDYDNFSLMSGMLPLFFLMFTLDTKISEKMNTLFDRLLGALGLIKEPMTTKKEQKRGGVDTNSDETTEISRLVDSFPTKRDPPSFMKEEMPNMMPQGGNNGGSENAGPENFSNFDGPSAANEFIGGSPF